ncbi:hypothetical protein AB0B25_30125 [Nocardia sp. NPDC049190]|uniref:hypothetical protein n=1 Tax=Nocardia sp. NPDC049190 TaxID=3155650 RepID=UPI0033C920B9
MISHEPGCTRGEAVEQVQRQIREKRAHINAVIRYFPAPLRMIPGLSDRKKEDMALYESLRDVMLEAHQTDRYTQNAAPSAPDLERLHREVYAPASTICAVEAGRAGRVDSMCCHGVSGMYTAW